MASVKGISMEGGKHGSVLSVAYTTQQN